MLNKIFFIIFIFLSFFTKNFVQSQFTKFSNEYKKLPNYEILSTFSRQNLIKISSARSLIDCLRECTNNANCLIVMYDSKNCKLYNTFAAFYLKFNRTASIYCKLVNK